MSNDEPEKELEDRIGSAFIHLNFFLGEDFSDSQQRQLLRSSKGFNIPIPHVGEEISMSEVSGPNIANESDAVKEDELNYEFIGDYEVIDRETEYVFVSGDEENDESKTPFLYIDTILKPSQEEEGGESLSG